MHYNSSKKWKKYLKKINLYQHANKDHSTTKNKMGNISNKRKSGKLKISSINLQDLPTEVLLKIFSYFDSKELIKFAHVSKRIRYICYDETNWRKINLYKKTISASLLEQILENGCKYLSLCEAKLEGNLKLNKYHPLKYLDLCTCKCEISDLNNLVASCESLEKLSLCFLTINSDIVRNISFLNGQSLQVLDLYYVKGTVFILGQ